MGVMKEGWLKQGTVSVFFAFIKLFVNYMKEEGFMFLEPSNRFTFWWNIWLPEPGYL